MTTMYGGYDGGEWYDDARMVDNDENKTNGGNELRGDTWGDRTSVGGVMSNNGGRCEIMLERCVTHNCGTSKLKVTSKKWAWIERKKKFGNVTQKTTKYICEARRKGLVVPEIGTQARTVFGQLGEVGRLSSNVNTRGLGLQSARDERESVE